MKVLVTGATGFVGSEVVRQLVSQGADVRILRRAASSLDLLGDVAHRLEQVIGDVAQAETVWKAMDGVTHVYHMAAHIGFGGESEREELYRINVEGTKNVVDAAKDAGVKRLVYTSSMAAFGRPERVPDVLNETAVWSESRFNTLYAHSKHLGELEVQRGVAEGLDAVIVNPAQIFGVGRKGENTQKIVEEVRDQKLPGMPAGGTNVVDVRDVAAGHILAMERGRTGQRYFLGSENISWRDIIVTLAKAFDVEPPRFVVPPTLAMVLAYAFVTLSKVTGGRPLLTPETARSSSRFYRYSNRRAVEELGCSFRPFGETAQHIANALRSS